MKLFLGVLGALLALSSAVNAADLGKGTYPEEGGLKDFPETAMWTGVTVGLGIGGAFPSFDASDAELARIGLDKGSVFGQAEAVASWQIPRTAVVLSGYGDLTYSDVYKSVGGGVGGRLGYAIGNVQPYALAGAEFARGNSGASFGGGVVFRATPKINLNVEWKHTEWGSFSYSGVSVDTATDTALIGVSYKIN